MRGVVGVLHVTDPLSILWFIADLYALFGPPMQCDNKWPRIPTQATS